MGNYKVISEFQAFRLEIQKMWLQFYEHMQYQ